MRINLGSGSHYWPGFCNVDLHADADIQSDVKTLPFKDWEVEEIYAIHIFEHIHRMEIHQVLLEWKRILKPGGKMVLELPSLDKIVKLIVGGEKNNRMTLLGLYGDPKDPRPGMMHQWGWGNEEMEQVLKEAGFENISFPEPTFHFAKRDMRVVCYKPNYLEK